MTTLTRASRELYRRGPDEAFSTLPDLHDHCRQEKQHSSDVWQLPQTLQPQVADGQLILSLENGETTLLNDWSFSQMCRLSGMSKETVNRLQPHTATLAFRDTLPYGEKPLQLLTTGKTVRSVHGVSYTRLWNSEVGRRSLGMQTFWFQRICQNHIVWDAVQVVEFTRKHTANVQDGLLEIRRHIEALVARRDARRDQFATVLKKAMHTRLGSDAEDVTKELTRRNIPQHYVREALAIARTQGGFTIFALVDALTRLTQRVSFAADRADMDGRVAQLLALAMAA